MQLRSRHRTSSRLLSKYAMKFILITSAVFLIIFLLGKLEMPAPKKLIKQESLIKDVRILGYRQDALEILKCMDFYISSSLSEGLPISMLEACAAEIPTIATEITGNKDILRNSVFGVLTESGSPESISEGIVKMALMPKRERDILTRNSLDRIRNHFSIEQMTQQTSLLYCQVLNRI